jgi:hypothetical protein
MLACGEVRNMEDEENRRELFGEDHGHLSRSTSDAFDLKTLDPSR